MALVVCVTLLLAFCVNLSEGVCPDGWIRHGQMCYHFSTETEDWASAKIICEAMKGQLVEIETAEENHFLGQQAQIRNKYYWTALTDLIEEDTWVWMNSRKQATYTNWKSGEPNNDSTENCVDLYPGGYWNDSRCRGYNYYICEKTDEVEIIG